MDRQMVLDHLALAEQHIADGKTTIERQQTLIPELERGRPRNYAVSGAFEPTLTNPKDARGGSKTAAPRTRKIGCWTAKTPVLSSAHPATPLTILSGLQAKTPAGTARKVVRQTSAGTIILPIGHSARPASFTCAQANGMPTMVMASMIALM